MNELSASDAGHRIVAVKTSLRAKLATLPKVDHNGRFEVDETATRYPCGLVDPTASGGDR